MFNSFQQIYDKKLKMFIPVSRQIFTEIGKVLQQLQSKVVYALSTKYLNLCQAYSYFTSIN